MNKKSLMRVVAMVVAIAQLSVALPAFAWTPGDAQCVAWLREHGSNHPECGGTTLPVSDNSTPYGGYNSAQAAATAFQRMNNQQRQSFLAALGQEQRTEVTTAVSLGVTTIVEATGGAGGQGTASAGASAAGGNGAGNSTSTTIGGTEYRYSQPVAGAIVGLVPGSSGGNGVLDKIVTGCIGDFNVDELRKTYALTGVLWGLWPTMKENGRVARVNATRTGLEYGDWERVGWDGDKIVEERTVNGYQAVIWAWLANSTAGNGATYNGPNGAGSIAGTGGVQTFGKEIDKFPCSFVEVRKLTPVPKQPEGNPDPKLSKTGFQPGSNLLTVRRQVEEQPRRGGVIADIPKDFCEKNPGKCRTVSGKPGKLEWKEFVIDCDKPANPTEAQECARSTAQLGQPPAGGTKVIPAPQ